MDLEKAEEPEIKLPKSVRSQRKQRNSRKTSTSDSLTTLKPLTMCITTNCDSLKGKKDSSMMYWNKEVSMWKQSENRLLPQVTQT